MSTSPEELLVQMEQILTELLGNARTMVQKSQQGFVPAELMALQTLQDRLMDRLVAADTMLRENFPNASANVEQIEKGLAEFQALNTEFLDNVKRQNPVIQFETEKAAKGHQRPPSNKAIRRAAQASLQATSRNTAVQAKKKQ